MTVLIWTVAPLGAGLAWWALEEATGVALAAFGRVEPPQPEARPAMERQTHPWLR